MDDDTRTMPLTDLIGLEAWEAYATEIKGSPTPEGFVRWVEENVPDVLRVLKEPVLLAVAERLVQSRPGSRLRRSGAS